MKRLIFLCITLALILALAGCGQSNHDDQESGTHDEIAVSVPVDALVFGSLEEFLDTYRGISLRGVVDSLADSVNLLGLTNFYLPIGIPENFELHRIEVNPYFVIISYLPREYLVSEEMIRYGYWNFRHFQFTFTRWDIDNPMSGILEQFSMTERDLIDGKYFVGLTNSVIWASEREVLHLYTPLPPDRHDAIRASSEMDAASALGFADALEMTRAVTAIYTIDLTNGNEIETMLQRLAEN